MIDDTIREVFTSQWRIIGFVSVLLLMAAEVGFRCGLRLYRTKDEAQKGQIGGIQGAILGLLALLLGFTFALAAGRYETRRELVLSEANAIGTTFLRAALLPETHQAGVENLLRRYVEARLGFYYAGPDRTKQAAAEKEAAGIQRELWEHAVAVAKTSPAPTVTSFISALNETIDLDAARLHALRTQVPGAVWLLVLAVAASGCCASGYGAGSSGARSVFANIALPMLISVVITLISDLDRPRTGLIGISQQPMLDLKQLLQARELRKP